MPETFNVLLNPAHDDAMRITIVKSGKHAIDPRLLSAEDCDVTCDVTLSNDGDRPSLTVIDGCNAMRRKLLRRRIFIALRRS